jgi:carbon starvation protein
MLAEGMVAILALISASVLQPGVYFAVNSPAALTGSDQAAAAATITSCGFPVTPADMERLAGEVGETTLFHRTGGAPSLALGMAQVFASSGIGRNLLGFWYHFAIMFEALFILTIIDAGTRVGRFMLQDLLGNLWAPLGRVSWKPGVIGASAAIVLAWGYFLYQGVLDPYGGVNSLWPMFGIANQLLGVIALAVGTTIVLKKRGPGFMWITLLPMSWILSVTYTASYQKIFSPDPRLGFLAQASTLEGALARGAVEAASVAQTEAMVFNARLNAFVCVLFIVLVSTILADSLRVWVGILRGRAPAALNETPFEPSALEPGTV